jgi:hypothetical protein
VIGIVIGKGGEGKCMFHGASLPSQGSRQGECGNSYLWVSTEKRAECPFFRPDLDMKYSLKKKHMC